MGFMDKAKKMAEQAQSKLDEAQKQFNAGQQQGQPSGPPVEYDEHGRPIGQTPPEAAAPPHGDPLAGDPAAAPSTPSTPGVPPTAAAPPTPPTPGVPPTADTPAPQAPPARPSEAVTSREARGSADAADDDRNNPSYAPPRLTSGDPLAG